MKLPDHHPYYYKYLNADMSGPYSNSVWLSGEWMPKVHVLHLFEEKFPQDDRPRLAIKAARAAYAAESAAAGSAAAARAAHAAWAAERQWQINRMIEVLT